MRSRTFLNALCLAVTLLALGGCSSGDKTASDRKAAQDRWAAARANVLVTLAKDQYRTGQFAKARSTVDEALRMTPESAPGRILSARLFMEKGELEAADRELASARQNTPNDGETYYLSGVILQRWQKHAAAYEMYKTAAEKSPAELAYMMAEAESLVTLNRGEEALALLGSKVDYFEHSSTIRDAIGQLQMQKGKYSDAARSFRQATILAEDDNGIKERLALALYKAKEFQDASDVIARLLAIEAFAKRADLLAVLGDCQLQLGRPKEARFTFEAASQIDPYSSSIWRGVGRAALESGDLKRAELSFSKALKFGAKQPETYLLLGYVLTRQERFEEALSMFRTASSLDPEDTVSLCMIGYVFEKKDDAQSAASFYGKALQIHPGDEMARRMMSGIDLHD